MPQGSPIRGMMFKIIIQETTMQHTIKVSWTFALPKSCDLCFETKHPILQPTQEGPAHSSDPQPLMLQLRHSLLRLQACATTWPKGVLTWPWDRREHVAGHELGCRASGI